MTVTGHAGQGRYGEDIVCAAASALVETLVIGLSTILRQPPAGTTDPGDADLTFAIPVSPEARAVIETIAAGLMDLAQTQPRHVAWRQVERRYPASAR
ncbi:MAG: ribosomal-processing cysteine protease Prp [Thermaerobacter sp.]|nr:ribosomal-processing cysteine protease Prp [Thermaerobacter sp.]